MKEEYRQIFLEESQDQIQEWEQSLLALEKTPEDTEQIHRLFRAIHTLKGSGGFVGFEELQEITHELESALQDVRDGGVVLTERMIELLFEGHDLARRMIDSFSEGDSFDENFSEFLKKLEQIGEGSSIEPIFVKVDEPQGEFAEQSEQAGSGAGSIKSVKIEILTEKKEASLRAVLLQQRLQAVGQVVDTIPPLDELGKGGQDSTVEFFLRTEMEAQDVKKALNIDQVKILSIECADDNSMNDMKGKGQAQFNQQDRSCSRTTKVEEVVRVPVEKLDVMLNLVGELVVQNSGFISTKTKLKEKYGRTDLIIDLEEKTESLANIARDLQDAVMKVRMLPVAAVFNRFNRVVRDLARDRGKEIHLEIYGEETEIDKKVMDRIGEPLVHLVRNAVDHGIETVQERQSFGKDVVGHIRMGAYQEGDHICIEVSDDGRGLHRETILKKAVQKGLVSPEQVGGMKDEEVFGLIFLAGFSTAQKVTDISGRGVGLDVVKRTVEEMGGVVRVKSTLGEGSVVTITLPLTMAIIPAILVTSGESIFAVPLSSVREVIKVNKTDLRTVQQHSVIKLREEVLSVADLKEVLKIDNGSPGNGYRDIPIVIVDYAGKKIGIGVEKLLGNEEIVIKSLSRHYREIDGLVGASILGNGKIALILDVEAMVRRHYVDDINPHSSDSSREKVRKRSVQKRSERSKSPGPVASAGLTQSVSTEETSVPGETEADSIDETENVAETDSTGKQSPRLVQSASKEQNAGMKQGIDGQDTGMEVEESLLEEPDAEEGIDLEEEQRYMLEEIHTDGAINASMSMSELMHRDIRVSFPETRIVNISDVTQELGGEEPPVGGIYVKLKGDVDGGILIVLPMPHVYGFSDLLLQREPGTTEKIGEEEVSGLTEMGNILSASFIRSTSDKTGLLISQEVPEFTVDMCLSVIDSVLARFNQPGPNIMITKTELYYGDTEQAICHLLLFLEPESLRSLIDSLKGGMHEEVGG